MGALSWIRVATKAVGLKSPPEYPHLEALLEAEEGQPHNDFRVLARILPPALGVFISVALFAGLWHKPLVLGATLIVNVVLMGALWKVLDYFDRAITPSKARIRKLGDGIWHRLHEFGNLVGVQPALSPTVGQVLDEAAAIYIKHSAQQEADDKVFGESYAKARRALEEAMARMLELAVPATPQQQELLFAAGWALPLLQEMRDMDLALSQPLEASLPNDPLANLRAARMEILGIETAIDELERTQARGH